MANRKRHLMVSDVPQYQPPEEEASMNVRSAPAWHIFSRPTRTSRKTGGGNGPQKPKIDNRDAKAIAEILKRPARAIDHPCQLTGRRDPALASKPVLDQMPIVDERSSGSWLGTSLGRNWRARRYA
jgi:hypothetical protein